MEPERVADDRTPQDGSPSEQGIREGATSERALEAELTPAAPGPQHDDTTSREAFEREMAEEGRSDEAAQYGDHIE